MTAVRRFHTIVVERAGATTTFTLNRPERRNAIGPQMVNELLHALRDAHADPETRVVVLTGAGNAFSAGGDFAQMTSGADGDELPILGDYADLLLALSRAEKPVIAAVQGHAMGGGLGLVAASTFAIASHDAKLGTPEVDVGLFPMMIMAVLARAVPRKRLLEMMLLGERLSADEAARVGIVTRAVGADVFQDEVRALADKLASKSPAALRLGLAAWAKQEDMDLEAALHFLRGELGKCLATDDAREGLTAFLEKRKPAFTGK